MKCCVHGCDNDATTRVKERKLVYVICAGHQRWVVGYMRAGPDRSLLAQPPRPGHGVPQQHGELPPQPGRGL